MKFDFREILETVQNLDLERVGSWPAFAKNGSYVIAFIVVFVGGNYFFVSGVRNTLITEKENEVKYIQEFEEKSFKSANLEEFKKQMEDLDASYAVLLKQLPKSTEVPDLLEDITHTGLESGLKFDAITPLKEEAVEFYVVLPIDLIVTGGFHGLAGFMSGIAALPRIVTLHDFVIEAEKTDLRALGSKLRMQIKAKTYRSQDEEG